MRKLTSLLLLVTASAFAATSKETFGTRSPHHQVTIERSASGDRIAYDVVVHDLDSGATMIRQHVEGKPGETLNVSGVFGTKLVRVELAYTEPYFTSAVNVIGPGGQVVDAFRALWQYESARPADEAAPILNAPGAYRVTSDVKAPVAVRRVNPLYPEEARRNNVSGIVIVEVLIGKDGKVKDAAVRKGLPYGLSESALNCVRQWEFQPATRNGEPVDVIFNLTIAFKL